LYDQRRRKSGSLVNTKQKGDIAQLAITFELVRHGIPVAIPYGDNQRYDLIAEFPRGLLRIQCKMARVTSDGGAVTFNACSIGYKARRGHYTALEVDLLAGYEPSSQKIYLVPAGISSAAVILRLHDCRNNQRAGIRWARNFELKSFLGTDGLEPSVPSLSSWCFTD